MWLRRRRRLILLAQQPSQKTGGVRRLRTGLRLLQLLLKLRHLRLGLFQGNILHQHRLGEDVNCVRVGAQFPPQEILRLGVFLLQLCLVDLLGQR